MEVEPVVTEEAPFEEYKPLPRPLLFPNKKSLISDDEDECEVNSDSSSDSDAPYRKRTKRTFDKSSTKSVSKYDVWAVELRANNLMDEIGNLNTNCNRVLDTSRDVESYYEINAPEGCTEEEKVKLMASKMKKNVKERLGKKQKPRQRHQGLPGARDSEKFERRGRSETRPNNRNNNSTNNRFRSLSNASSNNSSGSSLKSERNSVKSRLGKRGKAGIKGRLGPRPDQDSGSIAHGTPRELLDLKVTAESEIPDVVQDIANKLYEQKEDLIQKIVDVLGSARAIEIYNETKDMEAKGGMLVMNGTRRRTPGGVYIQLLKKGAISKEQMHEIFEQDRKVDSKIRRLKAKRRRDIKYKQLQMSLSNTTIEEDEDLKPLPSRKEIFENLCKSMMKTENADVSVKMESESANIRMKQESIESDGDSEVDCGTLFFKTNLETLEEDRESDMEIQPCENNGTKCNEIVAANENNGKEVVINKSSEDVEEGECESESDSERN